MSGAARLKGKVWKRQRSNNESELLRCTDSAIPDVYRQGVVYLQGTVCRQGQCTGRAPRTGREWCTGRASFTGGFRVLSLLWVWLCLQVQGLVWYSYFALEWGLVCCRLCVHVGVCLVQLMRRQVGIVVVGFAFRAKGRAQFVASYEFRQGGLWLISGVGLANIT